MRSVCADTVDARTGNLLRYLIRIPVIIPAKLMIKIVLGRTSEIERSRTVNTGNVCPDWLKILANIGVTKALMINRAMMDVDNTNNGYADASVIVLRIRLS